MLRILRTLCEKVALLARWATVQLSQTKANRTKISISIVLITVLLAAASPFVDSALIAEAAGVGLLLFISAIRFSAFIFQKISRKLIKALKSFQLFFTVLPDPLPASIRAQALQAREKVSFFLRNPGAALRALVLAPSFPRFSVLQSA
jgi:hypothetical protein